MWQRGDRTARSSATTAAPVSRPVALWVDLQRMADFLKAHPDQVVTVFLEDYVDPGVLRTELARVFGLSDVLYRPDRTGAREHGRRRRT